MLSQRDTTALAPRNSAAGRTGRLRVKDGVIVKKEEGASLFWLCVAGQIIVAIVVVSLGVFGLIGATRAHRPK